MAVYNDKSERCQGCDLKILCDMIRDCVADYTAKDLEEIEQDDNYNFADLDKGEQVRVIKYDKKYNEYREALRQQIDNLS